MNQLDILIVDDDASIRQLYTDAFTVAGISNLAAKDGPEAITLALAHHPTVILIDILMPHMNGHEVIKKNPH